VILGLLLGLAILPAQGASARVGGYVRVMARPGLQGGAGRLGHWNLYGRLMNEGPYGMLDLDLDVLEPAPGVGTPWSRVHARIEGGSVGSADPSDGSLAGYRLSQLYVTAGSVLLKDMTWQAGTLESTMGDLGLYDMRPAQVFHDTVGLSGRWERGPVDLLVGVGDSGFGVRKDRYNPVLTGGGSIRVALGKRLQLGLGGEKLIEPGVRGNTTAPYDTPGLAYEDWVRGEVVQAYRAEHPIAADRFPDPVLRKADGHSAFFYLGTGDGDGRFFEWMSTYVRYDKRLPEGPGEDSYASETHDIHVTSLTDERRALTVGSEALFNLAGGRLQWVQGVLWGKRWDGDNDLVPSDHAAEFASVVERLQFAATPTVGVLFETSWAEEESQNGNRYRTHSDSIFANTNGVPDTRGLEHGDAETRKTWQGKGGFVLTPLGPGVWSRPTLRLLYGTQWSSENNAFSNRFVESLDQYNEFGNVDQHWHHLLALEAEAWF
jgi:hypothetical protein